MKDHANMNRREFLQLTAGLGTAVACPALIAGCNANSCQGLPELPGYRPKVSSAWFPKGNSQNDYDLFQETIESTTDFTWLSAGDTVFLKLALNSYNPFPATTDPWALESMIRLLKEKGAGEIIVGDQSGVGHVYYTRDSKSGSSRQCCDQAGLLDVILNNGATPVFFEEADFDDGYQAVHPKEPHHWGETPIYITTAINNADHIINLPRVATHSMAGTTFALKLAIGYLRNDTRIDTLHGNSLNFNQRYEEINHIPEIESKVRLTVTSGRALLTTKGPDSGNVVVPEYGLVFATDDLLANDLLASAWLDANRSNPSEDIYCHPASHRYMEIKGGRPETVVWAQLNQHPDSTVPQYMKSLLRS